MQVNRPSATCFRVAVHRAAHQLLDNPKVFDDPLAVRIVGHEAAAALQADPRQFEDSPVSPYVRASVAARSRYAEEQLAAGVQRGVRQYVILGAGLDTFAYRNPYRDRMLRVFEVDHPSTQSWKRACLNEAGIAEPASLTFAPIDFESRTLAEGLRDAGFDPGKITFFSWLGVTEYLTNEAVMATVRSIASAATGSGVVFDYLIAPALLTPLQRSIFDEIAERVASAGEPWRSSFEPATLARELDVMGFNHFEDIGPDSINARYLANREDGLCVGGLAHLVNARV